MAAWSPPLTELVGGLVGGFDQSVACADDRPCHTLPGEITELLTKRLHSSNPEMGLEVA